MQVDVRTDGDLDITYDIAFANAPGAKTIDIVDIGMPHSDYDIGTMTASIDGNRVTDIRDSEYVKPGVEVHLGDGAIPPGGEGTLHLEFRMPDLLFQDTTQDGYASLQITPTWFDSQFLRGTGTIRIAIWLPPGIPAEAVLYQDVPFTEKFDRNGRIVAFWEFEGVTIDGPHRVGISFPEAGIAGVAHMTPLELAVKWLEDNPGTRIALWLFTLVVLGIGYFRFTGCTGWILFVISSVILTFAMLANPVVQLIAAVVAPILAFLMERARRRRRPRGAYLPAIAQVEGGGIKRGLIAPEAAVLLELPLHRVLSLVIFGLLKKQVLEIDSPDPLTVHVAEPFATDDHEARLKAAQDKGITLHPYEHAFIDQITRQPGEAVPAVEFHAALTGLIEHTATRVAGFDLSDTQEYYRDIVRRAITEAKSTVDLPARDAAIDRNFEWILIDDAFGDVLNAPGRRYEPNWWPRRHTVWVDSGGGPLIPSAPASGPSRGGTTSAGDVAASFAGWAEKTMGGLANTVAVGSLAVKGLGGGVIDLAGIDRVTMDVLSELAKASAKGGGGGGGGGGCACAGCACACACAGGGR